MYLPSLGYVLTVPRVCTTFFAYLKRLKPCSFLEGKYFRERFTYIPIYTAGFCLRQKTTPDTFIFKGFLLR